VVEFNPVLLAAEPSPVRSVLICDLGHKTQRRIGAQQRKKAPFSQGSGTGCGPPRRLQRWCFSPGLASRGKAGGLQRAWAFTWL